MGAPEPDEPGDAPTVGDQPTAPTPEDDDVAELQMLTRELPVMSPTQIEGTVRWFSSEKGYGFIAPDDDGDDVFVRYSSIATTGFRSLEAGQRVRFLRSHDARGPRAAEVEVIDR